MSIVPLHSGAALHRYVSEAKDRLQDRLPGVEWRSPWWDIGALRTHSVKEGTDRAYFTRHGSLTVPLPDSYADCIRAWALITAPSVANFKQKVDASRVLWEALLERGASETAFDFGTLRDEDLRNAESRMLSHWAESTTHTYAKHLRTLATDLADRGIIHHLLYDPATPRPSDRDHDLVPWERHIRDPRLPTMAALQGIADVFSIHATDPSDRVLSCASALLFILGLRPGEVLTLPAECATEFGTPEGAVLGIRYYSEKQRGGPRLFDTMPCSPVQAELVRPVLNELAALTAPARERALVLEADPDRVPLGVPQGALLTPVEVAELLGMKNGANTVYAAKDLKRTDTQDGFRYRTEDVEDFLLSRRAERLWTIDLGDGRVQPLSASLFVVFENFFHSGRGTNPLLVTPVTQQHVSDFLGGRPGVTSAFERFDIREPDGSFCRVTPKQFRHFLNDTADRGGMPIDLLTRLFNRSNARDTRTYLHRTPFEKAAELRNGIRRGNIAGDVALAYNSLPEDVRDDFLDHQVAEAHELGFGWCSHPWSVEPCELHLNCLRTCRCYHRTRGDAKERRALVQIQSNTAASLERARREAAEREDPHAAQMAEAWVRSHEETLAGVAAALAVDAPGTTPDGALVPVFPDGARSAAPLEVYP